MSKIETKLSRLFLELERELIGLEEENTFLKEKISQLEQQRIPKPSPPFERIEWVELESGKRFLTKKELAKYIGMSAGTISNQLSLGSFPIRARKVGRSVRFDMREVLNYLDTNKPFWERDKDRKAQK